jgi:altronate dehydratase
MAATQRTFLRLHPSDNVVVALEELHERTAIEGVTVRQTIRRGHKVCTHPIKKGEIVRKYGQVIGWAASDIEPGEHVHVHNVELQKLSMDYEYATERPPTPALPEWACNRTFMGYPREDDG